MLICDASNVTGVVDKLEARGLVARQPDPQDRRVKMLAVTDAGNEVRRRLLDESSAPPAPLAALGVEDQRKLCEILEKLLAAVHQSEDAA